MPARPGKTVEGESKMNQQRRLSPVRKAARVSFLGGAALILLTVIAFIATAIYEWMVPPTDMHLPGLVTAVMMLYVAPIGGVALLFGGLMWVGGSFEVASKPEPQDVGVE